LNQPLGLSGGSPACGQAYLIAPVREIIGCRGSSFFPRSRKGSRPHGLFQARFECRAGSGSAPVKPNSPSREIAVEECSLSERRKQLQKIDLYFSPCAFPGISFQAFVFCIDQEKLYS
jgi:hypothetical protein